MKVSEETLLKLISNSRNVKDVYEKEEYTNLPLVNGYEYVSVKTSSSYTIKFKNGKEYSTVYSVDEILIELFRDNHISDTLYTV